jgi:quinohemoprotein ethanol dehydrogenase
MQPMFHTIKYFPALIVVAVLTACGPKQDANGVQSITPEYIRGATLQVDDTRLRSADNTPGDWLSYGRNYSEDRYSTLDQIGKDNLNELGLAWTLELDSTRGIQATPLVVDGIMYFTGPWSVVYAVDARTGSKLWTFDPEIPRAKAIDLCCGVVNRGVALYKGAVFVGTLDGRLISIDAATGDPNWSVMTVPEGGNYSITGAPRIANGKVLIGNGGAEYANVRGFVTAYDAATGEQAWRFYSVPGDPTQPFEQPELQQAAETWSGEWWKNGAGGTAWDAIVYDPEFNQVYIGVGNGSNWDREIRSPGGGDNLFLSSIVAVDADTGAYKWHYQTTPGDTWDYTATQPIILADIEIGEALRKVLMQAPKNGFFYVLDRADGTLISAAPFSYMNWATGIDADGRPIEADGARYQDGRTHWITPSSHGGHNWFPMSYNHETGLVYIPGVIQSSPYGMNGDAPYFTDGVLRGNDIAVSIPFRAWNEQVIDPDAPPPGVSSGELIAYDPVNQERVWAIPQPGRYNGGLLTTTTGLLMQGDAEGFFRIRDTNSGEILWQFDVNSGIISSPVTYLVDGKQYITIIAEWGGGQGQTFRLTDALYPGTVYTFKLGGTAEAPPKRPSDRRELTSLTTDASSYEIGWGYTHYFQNCVSCHSFPGGHGGAIPNLARSNGAIFDNYQTIVRGGAFAERGMPVHDHLSPKDVEDLRAYVIYVAQSLREGKSSLEINRTLAGHQRDAWEAGAPPDTRDTTPEPFEASPAALNVDPVAGKRAAAICASCHSFEPDGPNLVGPSLWNIVGRKIASAPGASYSDALSGLDGAWTPEKLDLFLAAPDAFAPGTSMAIALAGNQQRADIVAYLQTLKSE